MKSAKIFMYDRYAGILKKMKPASSANEACFICHRDYIHFSAHFPTLFSLFIGSTKSKETLVSCKD